MLLLARYFHGPTLLSVQRVKNLVPAFPAAVPEQLAGFAARAVITAKDFRWRALAGPEPIPTGRPGKMRETTTSSDNPGALMLRLRLTLGVGVKADVLTFLLGNGERWATVREIAAATAYRERPVRAALDDLAAARAVEASSETPLRYLAPWRPWAGLLGIDEMPAWRHWHEFYAFAAAALSWLDEDARRISSDYVASSEIRRLVEHHAVAFERNRIPIPRPRDFLGEEYLEGFARTVRVVTTWLADAV